MPIDVTSSRSYPRFIDLLIFAILGVYSTENIIYNTIVPLVIVFAQVQDDAASFD